ncbi:MAG: response regulator of the LytR/AlgR family [Phenylobacterium sp.]|nr:response regulator of the LytR/AlgR family [Phenylobacterium sp.]
MLRVLAVGSVVATFLSLFGPFDVPFAAIAVRDAQYFAYSWIGSLLGLASVRIAWRLGLWPRGFAVVGAVAGLIMAAPMTLAVWLGELLTSGHPPPIKALPTMLWQVLLISVGASIVAVLVSFRAAQAASAAAPAPPKFLERLPLKLRGAEVWAVEAEDHYLRLHTSKGQDLILMRLADAVDELAGIEGMQVHRSWWVARDAIAGARRGDGRATLTLKDGSQVPASRTHARSLRERNWI